MKRMPEYFDANDQACFLETHNQKNVAFYEKYGFEVVEAGCLPDTTTTHWAMLRKPNKN